MSRSTEHEISSRLRRVGSLVRKPVGFPISERGVRGLSIEDASPYGHLPVAIWQERPGVRLPESDLIDQKQLQKDQLAAMKKILEAQKLR